jgi:hypothetical protein
MKQGILKMKNCSVIRGIRFTPIINDAERARRAAKELNNIGVEPADIGLLREKRTQQNWTLQPVSTVF